LQTRTDLVLVHAPVGAGHKMAALATAEAARRRGLTVEVLDLFEHAPPFVGQSYVAAHLTGQRVVPELYGSAYFAANRRDGVLEPVRRGFDHVAFAALVRRVTELRPRAVIATHHLPLVVLGRARRTGVLAAPLIGVVTDYIAHACWAEKGVDAFAVACSRAARDLVGHGVAKAAIELTGIPVRRAFETIADVRSPSPGEPLRVLVTSGGFGVGPVRAVVRSFAWLEGVELTVVCGDAPRMVARIEEDAARFGVTARVIGFERDMPARIADAHVVVGKAGGLTVSETMTAGRPMIIVGAVPGNETINAAMVVRLGAGYSAKPAHVGPLAVWMQRTGAVREMGRRARGVVPVRAADRVVDIAERLASDAATRAGPAAA
jgi:processive 1,2-diacylglycerol beta-glucosyltransferase